MGTAKRWFGALLALVVLSGAGGWVFVASLDLDSLPQADPAAVAADLEFLAAASPQRGRILAVVTSTDAFADGKQAGYELTELARAYWVFVANGYTVDVASPDGGRPTMVLDGDDVTDADYAFLNDPQAQAKIADTLALADVDPAGYDAVYFVGGKGAMFDFPGEPDIARIVASIEARGGVVAAVCHGPAALVGLRRGDGSPWLRGRRVAAFSNAEELFLLADARRRFRWLLHDALRGDGAIVVEGPLYLRHVVVDGRLVTGQNPWSTWAVAEAAVRALGHEPVARAASAEEASVDVLHAYRAGGFDAARATLAAGPAVDRRLLLMHALVAAMQGHPADAFQLQRLARAAAR
jgi:putative intracellular protease/amidase